MDQGPLVSEAIDAGANFAREFDRYAAVKAAFWVKSSDEDQRYLYLASDAIDDTNFDAGYGEVLRLANGMRSPYLDPFRVKLVGGRTPLALAAVDMNRRFLGPTAIRYGGMSFGGLSVDDVYIYPTPLPATT